MNMYRNFIIFLCSSLGTIVAQVGPLPPFTPSIPPPLVPVSSPPTETPQPKMPQRRVELEVLDQEKEPIAGVMVRLSRVLSAPSTLRSHDASNRAAMRPPQSYVEITNSNGVALFPELEPGVYRTCFSPPVPFLDPCEWGTYPTVLIPDGLGVGLKHRATLGRGKKVTLIVEFEDDTFSAFYSRRSQPIVPLKVGLHEATGRYHDFGAGVRLGRTIQYDAVIPDFVVGWPVAYAADLAFQLPDGRQMPGVGGRMQTWSESDRRSGVYRFRAVSSR